MCGGGAGGAGAKGEGRGARGDGHGWRGASAGSQFHCHADGAIALCARAPLACFDGQGLTSRTIQEPSDLRACALTIGKNLASRTIQEPSSTSTAFRSAPVHSPAKLI